MKSRLFGLIALVVAAGSVGVHGQFDASLRLMRYPAISPDGKLIAFCYNGDLYTVAAEGGTARLLVKHDATETNPKFSPDGKTLAFNSTRASSNADIYTIPVSGGEVTRLTFHTASDVLSDWTPDGRQLLFAAQRDTRFAALHTVEVATGRVRLVLEDDRSLSNPTLSPDSKLLVYQRGGAPWWRKGYRGSANADLWAFDFAKQKSRRLTTFDGNDEWPLWAPDSRALYFVSDRKPQPNLWRMQSDGSRARAVTSMADDDVQYPSLSRDGRTLVFEQGHRLWTLDTSEGATPREVIVWLPAPLPYPELKTETVTTGLNEFEVSPDGKQVAFVVRNDLYLMPAEGGEPTRLTDSPARDFDLKWSPDGRAIVFISTRDANADVYHLELAARKLTRVTNSPEAESNPRYSPDGRWLSFVRGPVGARVVAVPTPGLGLNYSERILASGPFITNYDWSPRGEWIAYSKQDEVPNTNVWIASLRNGSEFDLTNQSGNHTFMSWSADGKHLLIRSDRGGAVGGGGFGGGPGGFQRQNRFYVIDLQPEGFRSAPGLEPINFDQIQDRARTFTPSGGETAIGPLPDRSGMVIVTGTDLFSVPNGGGTATKLTTAGMGTQRITVTNGGTRFWLHGLVGGVRFVDKDKTTVTTVSYSVTVETNPRDEYHELFDEGWRILHNDFYDAKLHGADWPALREQYRPLVAHCWTKGDLITLMQELIGELNASHLGVGGAAPGTPISGPQTGALGVLFDDSFTGPGVRVASVMKNGPADKDASRLHAGEVITKLGEVAVNHPEQLHHALLSKGETSITITVQSKLAGSDGPVTITPRNRTPYSDLLYDNWMEANRERVTKLADGRLGYVHIKEMNAAALQKFTREAFGREGGKDALVIDVRYNPGGRIHDELLALLRKPHSFEYLRGTPGHPQPRPVFLKPMILLINQNSGSDAEIFPNGFRAYGNGKLVGVPTYGAVIGTRNAPLSDGTFFRLPLTGWRTLDGRNLENWGVPPDLLVESLPDDFRAGADRQLERAVAELLKDLAHADAAAQKAAERAARR